MMHLWVRAEERANERRVGITPQGVARLLAEGMEVTVEESPTRVLPIDAYRRAGAQIASSGAWRNAPDDAVIFGLKELPADTGPLRHRHILFGHAFKGQPDGQDLLARFKAGGGALYDLEYLVDETQRRVAAFGYWAGFVGAALSTAAWAAQHRGASMAAVTTWPDQAALVADIKAQLGEAGAPPPTALIIGALGRTGTGAAAFLREIGVTAIPWDMAETAHGGPFPEVLSHNIFLNCILAMEGVPVFVPADAAEHPRALRVIGDIACDPDSDFSPVKVYDRVTTWAEPTLRVAENPPLDVMAIDNLPSLLPLESSEDFAAQLLPHLLTLPQIDTGIWARAHETFRQAL
ncbi:saccharopine dehydrogenase [Gymnodinialimonas ceratoperidinii]|uniref:Saccharopine dehydrogenase [NAD(+), L-lysine-forming] n=1 Tax=Gymnodinialimonas ceratoperidinii TaxID=2856823 RepID=A0A8F6YDH9_9RHOB|nr:saccharopine dehydrogenase [Gymnodinialimonas ceratoperidinii]QXT40207.1 saccharopine dehydrogenase [Gymnodinialimonas ceratoperidinii]